VVLLLPTSLPAWPLLPRKPWLLRPKAAVPTTFQRFHLQISKRPRHLLVATKPPSRRSHQWNSTLLSTTKRLGSATHQQASTVALVGDPGHAMVRVQSHTADGQRLVRRKRER
jgi:hypothetical protein